MNADFTQDIFSGKQLLILGAGYVGRAVGESFQRLGGHVTALTRNSLKADALRNQGFKTIEGEISSGDWHGRIENRPHFVLDCVSSGGGGVEGYRRSYLEGAKSIVQWAKETGQLGHLIYTGSTSVYPQGEGVVVDEMMPTDAPEDRSRILIETEDTISQWPGCWSILRLAGIYGPNRHYLLDGLNAGNLTVPGSGETMLNLVHRDDIVDAVLIAFAQPHVATGKVFNVADDGGAPKAEVVRWLSHRLGRTTPEFTGKSAPGRRAFMPSRIISNVRIKAELGWSPRYPSFREGYNAILGA